jgi:cation-transporting ATPase E
VRANVFTRFNALLGGLLVVILIVGPIQDALFGFVLIVNTAIGIIQEVRARRTLDRLALLNEPRARVVRDGKRSEVGESEVVIDDVIDLGRGDQVVVDGDIIAGTGMEIDESLLTGEAEPVHKGPGDKILSGSAVVAGSATMRATAVGGHSFAQGLAVEARKFSLARSELQESNNKILRLVTWAVVPGAALLTWSQLSGTLSVEDALRGSVAGVANMIPEGLVLLTSVAFAVGAVRLARQKVLVRELAAVEGLARVDVLCIDKTGTLTTGELTPLELRPFDPSVPVLDVLAGLAEAETTPSASLRSLASLRSAGAADARDDAGVPAADVPHCLQHVPFSSDRRWSAATFEGLGSFVLGAPEALTTEGRPDWLDEQLRAASDGGHRVLLLARAPAGLSGEHLPPDLQPVALGVLSEQVRPDAAGTLAYLRDQGVSVKVISGDNPETVAAIAARVGLMAADPVDATTLPTTADQLAAIVEERTVFGRVGPREKRAMVVALRERGHVVAMTGDGVNDVLALREADLGIAMGSGSSASRAAGRVVLLDDAFAILPTLLAEGRRVLANVERVSKLFVTKTVYAALLLLVIGIARVPYPFYPRNFTVISTLTIGIPAFFLALPPGGTRLRSGYLTRVRRFVVPTGTVLATATLVAYLVDRSHTGSTANARAVATLVLGTCGLWVLARVARPLKPWKVLLIAAMAGGFALATLVPYARHVLAFESVTGWSLVLSAIVAASAIVLLEVVWALVVQPEQPQGGEHHRPDRGAGGSEHLANESTAGDRQLLI